MKQYIINRLVLVLVLFSSSLSWSLTREPQSFVISSKLEKPLAKYYFDNGYKIRRTLPKISSLDRLIIYGCKVEERVEHLKVLYICDSPGEADIQNQAFLLPVPSPVGQLDLATSILIKKKKIAVLYSKKSELQYKYLQANLDNSIELFGYRSYGFLMFNKEVRDIIKNSDAVLALSDDSIFNDSTQRALILNTFRERRPVFGPNKSFVTSGSIATLTLSDSDVAKSAVELHESFEQTEFLPGIYFPKAAQVITNRTASKFFSLNTLPHDGALWGDYMKKGGQK